MTWVGGPSRVNFTRWYQYCTLPSPQSGKSITLWFLSFSGTKKLVWWNALRRKCVVRFYFSKRKQPILIEFCDPWAKMYWWESSAIKFICNSFGCVLHDSRSSKLSKKLIWFWKNQYQNSLLGPYFHFCITNSPYIHGGGNAEQSK